MSVWNTIIGQPGLINQLTRAAAEPQPTHAWLFTSPPGAGKETAALAFAAALLCDQPDPAERGCGTCKSCTTALAGTHADLTNYTTENLTIKIEEARDFVSKAQDKPSVGRWRIMLINDADRMPERTSNVLLKAIEEPPPHTIWLLTAPAPHDVLITIRSRCRPAPLRAPQTQDILTSLTTAYRLDEATASHIVALAQGNLEVARHLAQYPEALKHRENIAHIPLRITSISEAMAAAYQLFNSAEKEAEQDATARNEQDKEKLLRSLGALDEEKMTPAVRAHLRRLEDDQKRRAKRIQTDTLDRFLIDIQSVFRDVLSVQLNSKAPLINNHCRDAIYRFAQQEPASTTLAHLETIKKTRERIRTNAGARLAFEAMMASFI